MAERTRLYGLALKGVGTPLVESFRGYAQRLALAHNFKPRVLIEVVLEMYPWKEGEPLDLSGLLKLWDVHGAGGVGAELRARFSCATGVDLAPSAVGPLTKLIAGQHLVKLGRGRYCPHCVQGEANHGQLLWELACVAACPVHQVRFRDAAACGAPKAEHLKLNARPKVPFACSTCGSIGFKCVSEKPEAATVDEIWVAHHVGRLLSMSQEAQAAWSAESLRQGLRELVNDNYGGSVVSASLSSGLARASVCTWVSGRHRPSLAGLMQLCLHARADVVELLQGRFVRAAYLMRDAAPSAAVDAPAHASAVAAEASPAAMAETNAFGNSAERAAHPENVEVDVEVEVGDVQVDARGGQSPHNADTAPRRPPDLMGRAYTRCTKTKDEIRLALVAAIAESPPPNLTQLARRLGTSARQLNFWWPEKARSLAVASRDVRQKNAHDRHEQVLIKYERSAAELASQSRPVTSKYIQLASGVVAFSQNGLRRRALDEIVSRYGQRPSVAHSSVGQTRPGEGGVTT